MKTFKDYVNVGESLTKDIASMNENDVKLMLFTYVTGVSEIQAYVNDRKLDEPQKIKAIKRIIDSKLKW